MKKIISSMLALILTAILVLAVNPSFAMAWDQHPVNFRTHQEINNQALLRFMKKYANNDKYANDGKYPSAAIDEVYSYTGPKVVSNSTFEDPPILSSHVVEFERLTFAGWVEHGGYSADEPNFWASVRHFYNPVPDNGPAWLNDQTAFKEVYTPISAKDWVFGDDNPFSWKKALDYYKQAMEIPSGSYDKIIGGSDFRDPAFKPIEASAAREVYLGKSFRSLGETMHMLADLTQPAHVRNDSHPFFNADPLEASIREDQVKTYANSTVDTRIGTKIDAAGATAATMYQDIAEYTNEHFYSNDTISDEASGVFPQNGEKPYPHPQFSDLIWNKETETYSERFLFLTDPVPMIRKTYSTHGDRLGIEMVYTVPERFADGQAEVLLPIAIQADSKLIDLFFPTMQLTETVQKDKETEEFLVSGKMEHLIAKDDDWLKWSSEIKYCGPAALWCERKGKPVHIADTEFEGGLMKKPLIVYIGVAPKPTTDKSIKKYQAENEDALYLVIKAGGRMFTSAKFKITGESIVPSMVIDPPASDVSTGHTDTFIAIVENPPAKARYEWTVDGTLQTTKTRVMKVDTSKLDASKAGPHTITCKLFDAAKPGSEALAEAWASITMAKATQSYALPPNCTFCCAEDAVAIDLSIDWQLDTAKNAYKQKSCWVNFLESGYHDCKVTAYTDDSPTGRNEYTQTINVIAGEDNKFTFGKNGMW